MLISNYPRRGKRVIFTVLRYYLSRFALVNFSVLQMGVNTSIGHQNLKLIDT